MTVAIPELPPQDSTSWRPWAAGVDAEARKVASKADGTHTHLSSQVTDFVEAVQDAAAGMFVAGTNITFSYNDAANTFTINAAGGGSGSTDPELVRDTIGAALVAGSGIQIVVNDAADTITIQISNFSANLITTGVVAPARLGTGTPSNTTVLYGDGTWKTAPTGGTGGGATGTTRTPEQYGAAGDGSTDDTAAINAALRAGTAGDRVVFAAGKTYRHAGVIGGQTNPVTAGITIEGYGARLLATDPQNCSMWIQADNVTVRGLRFSTTNIGSRLSGWERYRFLAKDCSNFKAHHCTVDSGPAAGIFMHNVSGFLLEHVTVRDTLADGVHISAGSRNGVVVAPVIDNVGDDGVAIVSYVADANTVANIFVYSPRVWGQTNGRGVSIVGGENIWMYDVYVRRSYGAGIYIANEQGQDFQTKPVTNSGIIGGLIEEANYIASLDHAGIFLLNQQGSVPITDVLIRDVVVRNMARLGQPFVNVKNSGSGGQFLRCTIANCRAEGRGNWLYPRAIDGGITENPSPYATANGVTFTDFAWLAPQERGRQKVITAATTLSYEVEGGTYICTGSSAYTVTLPTAGRPSLDSEMSRKITIFNAGTATLTVAGGGNVNGGANVTLAAKTGMTFINDGSAWWGW